MGGNASIPASTQGSFVIPDSARLSTGSGEIHRNIEYHDALRETFHDGVDTLYKCFQRGLRVARDGPCFGTRSINADGTAGDYVWKSYDQVETLLTDFGSGLINRELFSRDENGHQLLGLYCKNREEWTIAEQACNAYQGVVVPLYDTLGADAVRYVLEQTSLATVCCTSAEVANLVEVKRGGLDTFRSIVLFDGGNEDLRKQATDAGLQYFTYNDVLAAGAENKRDHIPPKPDDLCTFCYTSGTTGNPKGAMITHRNIMAVTAAAGYAGVELGPGDVHLSYLPLAHMFERLVQAAVLGGGGAVGYYQGDTTKLVDDIKTLRPTVFPSVPRLFNKFYDKIMGGVKAAGGVKAKLFNKAYAAKTYWLKRNYLQHGLWDRLVFNKVKARLGLDRCRLMITGSAPIAPHVLEFLRVVFGAAVVEGYGQTESAGVASVSRVSDQTHQGHVGGPLACSEIKLVNVEEMGYLVTDRFHGRREEGGKVIAEGTPCMGRGEVCYRGPNIFPGYYKNPEKTAEAIDEEGWLHSGDIGLWTAEGNLKIIDRKKNIFKLAQGEYVAAEKIENVYAASEFIAQMFVYGDSFQSVLVAIVVPDEEALGRWAAAQGITGTHAELCRRDDVKKMIMADMARTAGTALKGFEKPKAIHLESKLWTGDDLLTPTFKLKRNVAKEHYQSVIDELYGSIGASVAGKTLKQGEQ